jgi:hypothetical protein
VGKHEKGGVGAANGQVSSEEMEIPDAVHHHGVKMMTMGPDPEEQGKGKKAINPGAAKSFYGNVGEAEIRSTGWVEGGNLQYIAKDVVGRSSLPNPLNRATNHWIHGLNDMKNPQRHGMRAFQCIFGL